MTLISYLQACRNGWVGVQTSPHGSCVTECGTLCLQITYPTAQFFARKSVERETLSIRTTWKFVVLAEPINALLDKVDPGLDSKLVGLFILVPFPPFGTEKRLTPP